MRARLLTFTPAQAAFALAAYVAIVLNGAFWLRFLGAVRPASSYEWLFIAAVALCVYFALALLFGALTVPYLFKPLVSVVLLSGAAAAYFMREYGIVFDYGMIVNTLQTDRAEASELITWQLYVYLLVFGVIPSVWVLFADIRYDVLWREVRFRVISGAMLVGAIAVCFSAFSMNVASVFREHAVLKHELVPFNYLGALVQYAGRARGKPVQAASRRFGDDAALGASWTETRRRSVTVIVLGETARAQNFSLNGYERLTNPKLAAVDDLISFKQVASCGTATAQSLPCIFSGIGRARSTDRISMQQEGLLDILQRAGFSMLWRDNQTGCKGVCQRIPSENVWPGSKRLADNAISYDDRLVDGLQAWIDGLSGHGVVVLHMMGSHGPAYFRRYPSEFEHFKPACQEAQFSRCTRDALVNAYDNTIVYTDHVLGRLIETLKANDAAGLATAMIYVSDHGEFIGRERRLSAWAAVFHGAQGANARAMAAVAVAKLSARCRHLDGLCRLDAERAVEPRQLLPFRARVARCPDGRARCEPRYARQVPECRALSSSGKLLMFILQPHVDRGFGEEAQHHQRHAAGVAGDVHLAWRDDDRVAGVQGVLAGA